MKQISQHTKGFYLLFMFVFSFSFSFAQDPLALLKIKRIGDGIRVGKGLLSLGEMSSRSSEAVTSYSYILHKNSKPGFNNTFGSSSYQFQSESKPWYDKEEFKDELLNKLFERIIGGCADVNSFATHFDKALTYYAASISLKCQ